MKVSGASALVGVLGTFAVFGAMVALAFALGIPQVYGLSLGWGWNLGNQGSSHFRALTPLISSFGPGDVFLGAGEVLVVDFDLRLDGGRGWISIYDDGWGPGGYHERLWAEHRIYGPTRRTARITAGRAGFHEINGDIMKARGEFTVDWRVEQARPGPRMVRAGLAMARGLPGLFIALIVVAGLLALGKAALDAFD